MAPPVTEVVNHTQQVLNMKVSNHRYFVDFARIRRGAKHTIQVDYSDTYQEFLMETDRTGKNVIVTSDDCCDYQCITIAEVDGQFTVDRVPRTRHRSGERSLLPLLWRSMAPPPGRRCGNLGRSKITPGRRLLWD